MARKGRKILRISAQGVFDMWRYRSSMTSYPVEIPEDARAAFAFADAANPDMVCIVIESDDWPEIDAPSAVPILP